MCCGSSGLKGQPTGQDLSGKRVCLFVCCVWANAVCVVIVSFLARVITMCFVVVLEKSAGVPVFIILARDNDI